MFFLTLNSKFDLQVMSLAVLFTKVLLFQLLPCCKLCFPDIDNDNSNLAPHFSPKRCEGHFHPNFIALKEI